MSESAKPEKQAPDELKPGDEIPPDVDLRDFCQELYAKVGQINDRAEAFYEAIANDLKGLEAAQVAMFLVHADLQNAKGAVTLAESRQQLGHFCTLLANSAMKDNAAFLSVTQQTLSRLEPR